MNGNQALVVDASVVVKWVVPEVYSPESLGLLDASRLLLAPDFLMVEVANTFAKKVRRGEMDSPLASSALRRIPDVLTLLPAQENLPVALDIALRHGRSVYDALYVALALEQGCRLVTADERLVNALQTAFPGTLLWLGDM